MEIEFDSAKDALNRAKHGIPLELARHMELSAALRFADERYDYGENRSIAIGPIAGRLHVLAYTMRGDALRAISLRKANLRERTRYERST